MSRKQVRPSIHERTSVRASFCQSVSSFLTFHISVNSKVPVNMRALIILLLTWTFSTSARPEPPSSYFPPSGGGGGGAYPPGIGGTGGSGSYGSPAAQPASSYGTPQRQPIIHKHVYVHVPPPEAPEYKVPKYVAPAPPPQKHYKIVFIKAPTPPTPTSLSLPALPSQDEEKTLIYVLVKKPEEAPEVVLPTQAPTQPSKPEVYFIRYKTQKEQQSQEYGPPSPQSTPIDNYGPPSNGPY
ncbi:leucine-rich repeat extensin-like protein 2 [Belonocnema kinseyi]|uniref:leucine-rich repeat extensin-like protein 2 n=1 Tax=Belonocnema kinseyi TaxID=2817044 RepID=UPI00143DC678|nr:leucine-rich repeat extensin-like protein 2 [Belonocnema kinseyi]